MIGCRKRLLNVDVSFSREPWRTKVHSECTPEVFSHEKNQKIRSRSGSGERKVARPAQAISWISRQLFAELAEYWRTEYLQLYTSGLTHLPFFLFPFFFAFVENICLFRYASAVFPVLLRFIRCAETNKNASSPTTCTCISFFTIGVIGHWTFLSSCFLVKMAPLPETYKILASLRSIYNCRNLKHTRN